MQITDYIKPELLTVSLVLYFLGMWIKQSKTIPNRYIPMLNGLAGILICALYVAATGSLGNARQIAMALFTSVTQGILVAGLSTYIDQLIKQNQKAA